MGHCGEFFYALWANMANLVVRYGPLRRIWFCAMGHCDGLGYALWTTVWNEAVQEKYVVTFALWAIAQNLLMRYGP
jgi:hypothetical protein